MGQEYKEVWLFLCNFINRKQVEWKKKVKNKCAEILTEPMCVIWVIYPLGNLTTHRVMEIIMLNKVIEQTMWSMTLVSRTWVLFPNPVLFTTLALKICLRSKECLGNSWLLVWVSVSSTGKVFYG